MEKPKKDKNFFARQVVIRIAVLVVIIVIAVVILLFLNKDISNKFNEVKKTYAEIQGQYAIGESFSGLSQDSQTISPYFKELSDILPNNDEALGLSKEISDLASTLGLELNFSFKDEKEVNGLKFVNLSITAKGKLVNFVKFIEEIDDLSYFIDLTSFDISRTTSDNSKNEIILVKIDGRIFIK